MLVVVLLDVVEQAFLRYQPGRWRLNADRLADFGSLDATFPDLFRRQAGDAAGLLGR